MTRRAGIITIHDMDNYGNRLQNFAVDRLLASRGYEARTFILRERYFLGNVRGALRSAVSWFRSARYRRFSRFEATIRHRLSWSQSHFRRSRDAFDVFIVGSDQIWNPHFIRLRGPQFLDWTYPNQRIALAPSFGVNEIPAADVPDYTRWLAGFERISVREEAGAAIVRQLTGRDATVLPDPTLVLEVAEWRAHARDTLCPAEPYALTYFLGAVSPARRSRIEAFCAERSLKLVSLADPADARLYAAGPAEFLALIDRAACTFTDSYHGSIFSLLFDTPMVIFEREDALANMSSRLDTLLGTFGLENRRYAEESGIPEPSVDYADAKLILEAKRREFTDYLDSELARAAS